MSLVLVRKPLFPAPPRWFAQHQIRSSLFFLGEYVDTPELVDENVAAKLEVAKLLGEAGLDVHVSVDPTQIGYSLDPERARNNAFLIAEAVAQGGTGRPGVHALMFDMEDQSIIDGTIALHSVLFSAKMPVALTLQAYLLRTKSDLLFQIQRGTRIRLVKGAFAAGREAAFTRRTDIKANSRRLIDLMFSRAARDTGFYPIIATYDDRLQQYAIERAAKGVGVQANMNSRCYSACVTTSRKVSLGAASVCVSTSRLDATGGHTQCGALGRIRAVLGCCGRLSRPRNSDLGHHRS